MGFNFTANIARFRPAALARLFTWAAEFLVRMRHYPATVLELVYDPAFLIRGLSLDVDAGVVMKLSFHREIMAGTAHYGRRRLSDADLASLYGGSLVRRLPLRALIDPLDLVAASLTLDVIHLFAQPPSPSFRPRFVWQDVCAALALLTQGRFSGELAEHADEYLYPAPGLAAAAQAVRVAGKKLFLLTNCEYAFVDAALKHLLRDQLPEPALWPQLFDLVCVAAHRPSWFEGEAPFRSLNPRTHKVRWLPINELRAGSVYCGGSLAEARRLLPGFASQDVLFLSSLSNPSGEDPWADLATAAGAGWRTGAIVEEVEREVLVQSHPRYRALLAELTTTERAGRTERTTEVYDEIKGLLNPRFGSVFRTVKGPSLFAHSLLRHADLYTGRLQNVLDLAREPFMLLPLRRTLPHEPWIL